MLSQNVVGGMEEFSRNSQPERQVARPRFEASVSRMQRAHYHLILPVDHFNWHFIRHTVHMCYVQMLHMQTN
jgi:hypothetical protein